MSQNSQSESKRPTSNQLKRWLPLVILASLVVIVFSMGWHQQLSLSNLIINRTAMHEYVSNNFWVSSDCLYVRVYHSHRIVISCRLVDHHSWRFGIWFRLGHVIYRNWCNRRSDTIISCSAYFFWLIFK